MLRQSAESGGREPAKRQVPGLAARPGERAEARLRPRGARPGRSASGLCRAAIAFAAACTAACGGGGGGDGGAPPNPPVLSVSPASLEITATVGGDPAEVAFKISNTGGGTLSFDASADNENLALAPESGSVAGGASATVNATWTCRSAGTHTATARVTGAGRAASVSLSAECRPASSVFDYADGPQLPPGAEVPTPWHMTNVQVNFTSIPDNFDTFCTTFRIEGEVAEGIRFYFSPFNSSINKLSLYGGLQTYYDGRGTGGSFEVRGRGGIFSRWEERDTGAIRRADGGLIESSGHEGNFISVRNDFAWGEGRYRQCLVRSDQVAGDPLPGSYAASDIAFAWNRGKYAHTWVRMEATNLDSGATMVIGALAFPGRTLKLPARNILFAEMYGNPNPFPVRDVPAMTLTIENFQLDDKDLPYALVRETTNPIPETGLEPIMTRARFNADSKEIRVQLGDFTGRFGKVTTDLLPAGLAIESVGLVSADGEKYVLAVWDGREVTTGQLPGAPVNLRADTVDNGEIGSVRLRLRGAVNFSRLVNGKPYLLSAPSEGLWLPAGDYRITVTPYPRPDGQGIAGKSYDVNFTLSRGPAPAGIINGRLLAHLEAALETPLSAYNIARQLAPLETLAVRAGGVADLDGLQYATNLRSLRLPGNRIADLSALSSLSRLEELDLSGNRIENIVTLGELAALRRLDLSNNRIAEIAPLASLPDIEQLNVSGNRIAGLEALAGMTTLKRLELARNNARNLAPLASLTELEALDLSGNRASDLAPLAALIGLRQLKANANAISGLAPLAGLVNLRHLAVSGNRAADLAPLAGLQNLTRLEASDNRIARVDPLSGLPALAWLELDGNRIRDLRPLAGLTGLRALDIRRNEVRDFTPLDESVNRGLQLIGP